MIKAGLLVAAVAAPAAMAIGLWAGEHPAPPQTLVTPGRQNAPLVTKPGWGVAAAARYFAELNAPPPPPPPPPRPVVFVPPPPPPPDVGPILRREVSAVMGGADGSELRLILAGGRKLGRGDVYRDGWVLSSLTSQTAVLTKANETKSVSLFTPVAEAVTQVAAAPAPVDRIVFSNGQRAGQMSAAQINQLMAVLRQSGTNQNQIAQLQRTLQSGQQVPANQLVQLLMTAGRGGGAGTRPVPPAQITALANSLANSGLMSQQQANQVNQQIAQMGNQQVNNIIRQIQQPGQQGQQGNRGGGGGGGGPNSGFNAPPPPRPSPPALVSVPPPGGNRR